MMMCRTISMILGVGILLISRCEVGSELFGRGHCYVAAMFFLSVSSPIT